MRISACGLGDLQKPRAERDVLVDEPLDRHVEGQAPRRPLLLGPARDGQRPIEGHLGDRQGAGGSMPRGTGAAKPCAGRRDRGRNPRHRRAGPPAKQGVRRPRLIADRAARHAGCWAQAGARGHRPRRGPGLGGDLLGRNVPGAREQDQREDPESTTTRHKRSIPAHTAAQSLLHWGRSAYTARLHHKKPPVHPSQRVD